MYVSYPILGLSYRNGCLAICGGGGSMKSGIKNCIDIYRLCEDSGAEFCKEICVDTGNSLATGVTFSHNGLLLAVSVKYACWVYEIDQKSKTASLLVKFRTDFASAESSQSCASFVGNSTLLTGGEDGTVRVWRISQDPSAIDVATGTSTSLDCSDPSRTYVELPELGHKAIMGNTMIILTREYKGHTKRVREICVDQSHRNMVVTTSEDQSCHLWRVTENVAFCKLSKDDALDIAYDKLQLKRLQGVRRHQFRCAKFANSGRELYTVLTQARGDALLIKWIPATICQLHPDHWDWEIETASIVEDRPVASLCVSPDDRFISTAAVTGEVRVFLTCNLAPYALLSTEEHSFAVTGMSFATSIQKNAVICHLITGGADKKLLWHTIPLKGGEISPRSTRILRFFGTLFRGFIRAVLGIFLTASLIFMVMLFLHVNHSFFGDGPLRGFEELSAINFESMDSKATLAILVSSTFFSWLLVKKSSVGTCFLWNAISLLTTSALAFQAAASSDMMLQWRSGDANFDELLGTFDYKVSIIMAALAMPFIFMHSILSLLV